MFDFLKDHAYKNVWCTPDQDTQIILEPAKLTPFGGVKNSFKVIWRDLKLPDDFSKWHVYQIGQVHPLILGLFPKNNTWTSFAETCNRQKMICDVYTVKGIQIPRVEAFYIHNEDRNLIVAIRKNDKLPNDFNLDKVFLRLYSNQYFNSLRVTGGDNIHVEGGTFNTIQEILDFQAIYDTYVPLDGVVYSFVNGYKVDKIDLITVKPGDVAEFVYDSSIYKTVDFKFSELREFNSNLDLKRKYLLHYDGVDNLVIDFQDDVDVFIYADKGLSRNVGVYYNKNNPDSMRMVTHRDYSIVVDYANSYLKEIQKAIGANSVMLDDFYVRLHIRKSGWFRNLVFENSRIHEMYKMSDDNISKALLGIDSTVYEWRADQLESSKYTEIMRSFAPEITNEMVQYGYGYNAISKIIADTPSKTYLFSSQLIADVPYSLLKGCTAYEYDADGLLLGWYYFPGGEHYICTNSNAHLVEFITGRGSNLLDEHYGFTNIPNNDFLSFRVYECRKVSGIVDNNFRDVTNVTGKYKVEAGRIVWIEPNPSIYPVLRTDDRFLAYDTELYMNRGELKLTLNHLQRRGTTTSNWVMQIPMGEIDIFMNGKSLIRNLDYIVKFPEIMILNKEYLIDPINTSQKFHVRFMGFCTENFGLTKENDVGFVEHGVLSNNNKYDIRDDKVLRILFDGKLITRDDLIFSEFHSGVSIINALNGRPYQVKDIVVPMRGLTQEDTYSLREKSLTIDKSVSEYLSKKIPQPERNAVSAITARYQVFSPFICRLIYDLADSRLAIEDKIHSVTEVVNICKPYEKLLDFDPTQLGNKLNDGYVIIHPHSLFTVIQLSLNKYRFVETAVRKYTNGLVTLSPFVQIAP